MWSQVGLCSRAAAPGCGFSRGTTARSVSLSWGAREVSDHTIVIIWVMKLFFFFSHRSSVYSCHLFLISTASVRFILFLSFIEPIFAWNVPLVSLIFLKRSLVFPILLFSSNSLHWSLRKVNISPFYSLELCIQMGISFLFSIAFYFSSFLWYL